MVSRAWLALTHCLIAGLLTFTNVGFADTSVRADDGGVCLAAYGKQPDLIPAWLEPASSKIDLTTHRRYDLLVGKLLSTGLVDGSVCPANGLNPDGSPNGCGMEVARESMVRHQNFYDDYFLATAEREDLPPRLMKALIAVESQFWPGADWQSGEIGLAQITSNGADMVLANRPGYYGKVCIQVFGNDGCDRAYLSQTGSNKALLIGQVLQNSNAICPTCAGGVDLERGELAIGVLAEALNASCLQVARSVVLVTGKAPAQFMKYEDFWRLVLVNYHAGAGCLYTGLRKVSSPSSWSAVAGQMPAGCGNGRIYVRRIESEVTP